MASIDTTYQVKSGEKPADYQARIDAYNASKDNGNSGTSSPDAFTSALQDRLLKQTSVISSATSGIDAKINSAIQGITSSVGKNTSAIESSFQRAKQGALDTGQSSVDNFSESRGGFATQMVALRNLVQTTDKNVNDLEQRKNELIMQGEADAASKISELQLKSLEFKQQSEQNVFNNLLSLSNFGLALKQDQRQGQQQALQERQQSFAEKQSLAQIGLEFGLPVTENDTIDTMVAKAAPLATEERKLKLEQMRAEIQNSKAQAARALKGDATTPIDSTAAGILADFVMKGNPDVFTKLSPEQQNTVAPYIMTIKTQQKTDLENMTKNMTQDEFVAHVQDPNGPVYDSSIVQDVLINKYLNAEKKQPEPTVYQKYFKKAVDFNKSLPYPLFGG